MNPKALIGKRTRFVGGIIRIGEQNESMLHVIFSSLAAKSARVQTIGLVGMLPYLRSFLIIMRGYRLNIIYKE